MARFECNLGSLWRGFKVNGKRAAPFVGQGTVEVKDDGKIALVAKYDPPGSGWFAVGAAIVTGLIVTAIAQALGFFAGPGWLLWYLIFLFARRQTVHIDLHSSESVVTDHAQRRLAFHTDINGKPGWAAFEVTGAFDEMAQQVEALAPAKASSGRIARRFKAMGIVVIVVLALNVVGIAAAIITPIVMRRATPKVVLVSHQSAADANRDIGQTTGTATNNDPLSTVKNFFEGLNAKRIDTAMTHVDDTAHFNWVGSGVLFNQAEIRKFFEERAGQRWAYELSNCKQISNNHVDCALAVYEDGKPGTKGKLTVVVFEGKIGLCDFHL